ncbi:MAG: hypothetical protein KAT77_00305 [Nanoarchaeota archaeon]|nr:hypothetical protein [Nanoarchaeota archaeon]
MPEIKFEIKRLEPTVCNLGYTSISYQIFFQGDQPSGQAGIKFKPFETITPIVLSDGALLTERLTEAGINPEDDLTHITHFFPNGRSLDVEQMERYTRNGVGSAIFSEMMKDISQHGSKAIYVVTNIPSMRSFLDKKGFSEIEIHRHLAGFFYKLL